MQIEVYDDVYNEDSDETPETLKNENSTIVIDIAKIKEKKFIDKPPLEFYDINDFILAKDGYEGYYSSYSELSFYGYKYHLLNGFFPQIYRFEHFNRDKFINLLFKYYEIPFNSFAKVCYQREDEMKLSTFFMGFKKDLLIHFDGKACGYIFYNIKDENENQEGLLYTILGLLKSVKIPKVIKNKIYVVYRTQHGFDKMGFDVNKVKVDLNENYNDGFLEKVEEIIKGLNSKNKTNLVILSGSPGTGKTTFIRYLTSKLKKNIIFISPDMVDSITDPAFIPFLMKNNDSILIIEDAEPALEKRNQGGRSSAVSNVLNLTDGLLSDCLKISIVATFNTGAKSIDDALTRKGRLLMNYVFEKLSVEKSKNLLAKLGHPDIEVKEPMTLADIYYYGTDNNIKNSETKIGFGK